MTYEAFKDLPRRTAADKVLRDKAFNIAKNPKYDRYQRGPALMVYKCFDKRTFGGSVKSETMSKQESAEECNSNIRYIQISDSLIKEKYTHLL